MPDTMNLKERLTEHYEKAFAESRDTFSEVPNSADEGPANPLLISPPQNYDGSTLKVMYFGQETDGWEGSFQDSEGVQHLLRVYEGFANQGRSRQYGKHFWNALHRFDKAFSAIDSSTSFTWNNIIKVGRSCRKGTPSESVLRWQDNWFKVLKEEVRILQPNVIIFLTGPNYDKYIKKALGPFTLEPIGNRTDRQLARVKCDGLPEAAFRTYHPNYLWRNGFYDYLGDIITEFQRIRMDTRSATSISSEC